MPELYSIHKGRIATLTDFGIFVSLENFERLQGLVHISQVVKRRVEASELKDMFAPGENCWVKVLSVDQVNKTKKCTDEVLGRGREAEIEFVDEVCIAILR
jgi:predicted RNA-binding protein with RPS1 domain